MIRQSDTVRKSMEDVWGEYRRETEEVIKDLKNRKVITSTLSPDILLTMMISVLHGIGIQVIGEPNLNLIASEPLWQAIEDNLQYLLESH